MNDHRHEEIWRDLAHTVEVVAAVACARDHRSGAPGANHEEPSWPELAHTSDVLLASALARADLAVDRGWHFPRWRRFASAAVGLLAACCLLVVVGRVDPELSHLRHAEPAALQVDTAKRFEIVNASQSSSIVSVRVASPDAGIAKVIDLPEPIPPTSIQPFWHFPTGSLDSPPRRICLVYFSAAYASGAEADFQDLDLCRDNQVLVTERAGPASANASSPGRTSLRPRRASTEALRHSLDFYAAPSRRAVNIAKTSADGSKVVTLAGNSTVQLWDAATGRVIAPLAGHGAAVEAIAFSPDGREVITLASDRLVQRWDASTGRELNGFPTRSVPAPASPDEKRALDRDVAFRDDAPLGAEDPAHLVSVQSGRRLAAGSSVEVLQAYGPWTLITTAGNELGYVPSDALVHGLGGTAASVSVAGANQAESVLGSLERRIGALRSAQNYADAAALAVTYAESIELRYGSEHPRFATALDILSQLSRLDNRTDEAVLASRRALAIREKTLGLCDPAVLRNVEDLAQLYRVQGHPDRAGSVLDRSCPR